jgi:ribonuclease P protein component
LILKNTFHKNERLSSKKQIDYLFEKGSGKSKAPIKVMYLAEAGEVRDIKAMFVVPKKKFKRAHDRNKLRRRMKEAYRLKKNDFYSAFPLPLSLKLAFIYTSSEAKDHSTIQAAVHHLLAVISKEIVAKSKTT